MGFFSAIFGRSKKRPPRPPPRPPPRQAPRAAQERQSAETHLTATLQSAEQSILVNLDGALKVIAVQAVDPADRQLAGRLRERLRAGVELRTMPQAMLTIQRLLAAPDCKIQPLSQALKREPTIASRIVALANCALYRGQSQLRAVEQAVIRIGLTETKNIVMAIACRTKLFRLPGSPEEANTLYWRALASAVSGRLLAEALKQSADGAFIGCMLADLGRIVILSQAADLRRDSRGQLCPTTSFIERTSDEVHAAISALIAESWGYDRATIVALLCHHAPREASSEAAQSLAKLIFAADLMGQQLTAAEPFLEPSRALAQALRALKLEPRAQALLSDAQRDYNEFAHVIEGYQGPKHASQIRGKLMSI